MAGASSFDPALDGAARSNSDRPLGAEVLVTRRRVMAAGLAQGGALMMAGLLPGCVQPSTYSEQQRVVDRAVITVNELRNDRAYGNAPELIRRARAIMIVPELVKAGFFFGGEGGNGVLLARLPNGAWSYPAFYSLGSVSFGLQIGIEQASVGLLVMSERALNAWMADQLTLGAKASLAVITLGSNVAANATTAVDGADVIGWSEASGAYAGLTLEGALIQQRYSYNDVYYGRPASAQEIVRGYAQNQAAEALRTALGR